MSLAGDLSALLPGATVLCLGREALSAIGGRDHLLAQSGLSPDGIAAAVTRA